MPGVPVEPAPYIEPTGLPQHGEDAPRTEYGAPPMSQPSGKPPTPKVLVPLTADQKYARNAFWVAIASIFIFNIVLGPIAIYMGVVARRKGQEELGKRAILIGVIGTIIGILAIVLSAMGVIPPVQRIRRQNPERKVERGLMTTDTGIETRVIDGKAVAAELRVQVADRVAEFEARHGRVPSLTTILVGDDPASNVYVNNKHKACAEVGIDSADERLPSDTSTEYLAGLIEDLNRRDDVDGILLQLPLPRGARRRCTQRVDRPEEGRRRADHFERRPCRAGPRRARALYAERRDDSA